MKLSSKANQTDAVLAIDISGRLTYVNRRAEILFGRSRFDLLGTPLSSVFEQRRETSSQGVCALSRRAMEESCRFGPVDDWVQVTEGAGHRVTDCYAEPIRDRYGLTAGAIIIARTTGNPRWSMPEHAHPALLYG